MFEDEESQDLEQRPLQHARTKNEIQLPVDQIRDLLWDVRSCCEEQSICGETEEARYNSLHHHNAVFMEFVDDRLRRDSDSRDEERSSALDDNVNQLVQIPISIVPVRLASTSSDLR